MCFGMRLCSASLQPRTEKLLHIVDDVIDHTISVCVTNIAVPRGCRSADQLVTDRVIDDPTRSRCEREIFPENVIRQIRFFSLNHPCHLFAILPEVCRNRSYTVRQQCALSLRVYQRFCGRS